MANAMQEAYMRGSKHAGKGGGEKELKRVVIQESDNGGFIVECEYEMRHEKGKGDSNMPTCGMSYETTKKVFEDWDKVADLLDDLYGNGEEEED